MKLKYLGLGALSGCIIVGLVIAGPFLVYFFTPQVPTDNESNGVSGSTISAFMSTKQSNILAVQILGNSSDTVYPELMDALFLPIESGEWNVTAHFLNDSLGPLNPFFYARNFQATVTEVETINNAIYAGLENATQSSDNIQDILASIEFGIDILYNDGTWIQLFTLQTIRGHFMFLNGTYSGTPDPANPFGSIQRDENWLNGVLMEPGTALNQLVNAMHEVFVNHLE